MRVLCLHKEDLKMTITPDKLKAMFMDLGKPTKRGVRKCPLCGTINGTRGLTCKNRECAYVFKEGSKKPTHSSNAVRVVTGSSVQVFSVRLRDRGPDYRGFVQLPLIQDLDGNPAENVDPAIMMSVLSSAAKCYVENCPRSKQNNDSVPVCLHIKSSINCSEEAQPLTLKNSVLNALDVVADIKEAIWLLATETSGPLVQRATKNIFIVKTKPSARHPLGFLHFAFFSNSKGKDGMKAEDKFICTCKQFKSFPKPVNLSEESKKKCIHFYSCICAFASDDALVQEFAHFINMATFTEILPDNIETTVVFGANNPNILLKPSTTQHAEATMSQFESLDGDSSSFSADTIEQQIQEEELRELEGDTAVELQDNFEDTEDVVTDVEDVHLPEQGKDDEEEPVLQGSKTTENQTVVHTSTRTHPVVQISSGETPPKLVSIEKLEQPLVTTSSDVLDKHTLNSEVLLESRPLSQPVEELDQVQIDNNIEVIIDDHNQLVSLGEPLAKRSKMEDLVYASEPSDTIAQASSALLTLQEATTSAGNIHTSVITETLSTTVPTTTAAEYRVVSKKHTPVKNMASKHIPGRKPLQDENSLHISFHHWLGSVTERINQTMHYQFDGSPEPLVFHAPQIFFDSLQARISAGSKKKRLPNSTTGFIRRDALPLGTFTKYTWHIINILHVKQIFDTPDMHLDVTRSFIENKDGTFDLYDKHKAEAIAQGNRDGKNNYLPIRPFELKTYLKVGHTSPNQKEATPFIIEWIPDILPKSRIGELRIKFEYGHQRNGQIENRTQAQVHT